MKKYMKTIENTCCFFSAFFWCVQKKVLIDFVSQDHNLSVESLFDVTLYTSKQDESPALYFSQSLPKAPRFWTIPLLKLTANL